MANTVEGALGSFGAALLEPVRIVPACETHFDAEQYSDDPSTDGLMLVQPLALSAFVKQFWEDGWQVVRVLRSS